MDHSQTPVEGYLMYKEVPVQPPTPPSREPWKKNNNNNKNSKF